MTTTDAFKLIDGASRPESLFGKDPDEYERKYRELAKLVHPDKSPGNVKASAIFAKLSDLYSRVGTKPVVTTLGKWIVSEAIGSGDIADIYNSENKAAIKIARSTRDTDLMERERFSLKFLHAWEKGDEFKKYIPKVLDSFDASGRSSTVLSLCIDQMPLNDIAMAVKPLDFRHVVWMVNRTLSALGFIHSRGVIHGSVIPPHLLFGPKNHSLSLIDWCYSVTVESKNKIPAISKDWERVYAPEAKRKVTPSAATDIYMLFSSLLAVGIKPPARFRPIFDWCLAASQLARPSDAFALQDRWLEAAKSEYGPPKYLELVIPKN